MHHFDRLNSNFFIATVSKLDAGSPCVAFCWIQQRQRQIKMQKKTNKNTKTKKNAIVSQLDAGAGYNVALKQVPHVRVLFRCDSIS